MIEMCTDGRFEVIARAKEDLLRCTNIDTSPSEMAVIDEILFRCWQMGWLDRYEDHTPHGRWEEKIVKEGSPFFWRRFYCTACNDWTTHGKSKFCPNCGARMENK